MKMKELADKKTGQDVRKAVVTVPAFFNAMQKQATMDACRIAGLIPLRLICEPTSAAIAYKFAEQANEGEEVKEEEKDDDKIVLIFDIGGGTFDVTLLSSSEGLVDVLGTKGDMRLGGRDFDNALVDIVLDRIKEERGVDLAEEIEAVNVITLAVEACKRQLTSSLTSTCRFGPFQLLDGVFEEYYTEITLAEFEEACEQLF